MYTGSDCVVQLLRVQCRGYKTLCKHRRSPIPIHRIWLLWDMKIFVLVLIALHDAKITNIYLL